VKAFKSTALAKRLAADGHVAFCAATTREVEGLANAHLGEDILLANESLDPDRLAALAVHNDQAQITVAVDSAETIDAAKKAGLHSVLIDVEVGLPRCGCAVDQAGPLGDAARSAGLIVRGVMGYEGHLMMIKDRAERSERVHESMAQLLEAADAVGGPIISGGGTGTFDTNTWCTEIQAGSYTLMDTQYDTLDLPFRPAATVRATVISKSPKGWIVVDAGLKSFGMDHGDPSWDHGDVFFCSDEHTTLAPTDMTAWSVGDHVSLTPAHIDPTIAKHEVMWLVHNHAVLDRWEIDLRHW
jgi:D-serine deaminase-like pyridoxal phosphate-dependent protein